MIVPEGYNAAKIKKDILEYDKLYPAGPDSIYEAIMAEKRDELERQLSHKFDKHGVQRGDEAGKRVAFTMPSLLYRALRKKYPRIFKEDLNKFKRDFPVFFKAWKI